ncbi:MAG: OmpA family protein, partial [Sneathiella sp.]
RSLFDIKGKSEPVQQTKPIATSKEVFQDFLSFRNIGNHRFFISTFLLVLISVWMTYHAGSEAQRARHCALQTRGQTASLPTADPLPVLALILERDCLQTEVGAGPDVDTKSLTALFIRGLLDFYDFTPVTLQADDGEVKLLHLATTSRYDLFFNGASGRSLAVPRGAFSPNNNPGFQESVSQSVQALEQQIKELEDKVATSNQTLFGVSKDLQSTQDKLVTLNQKPVVIHTSGMATSTPPLPDTPIPEHCWKQEPDYIIPYITSAYHIDNASILDALAKLSSRYKSEHGKSVVITGYADPSGGYRLNQRLSDKRARAVSRLFEKLGVDRNRLFPVGMGENEGKQLPPRRVEIRSCRFQ